MLSLFLSLFLFSSYWYNNTCLFPDMGTVFIAIDKTDVENGCLKVCTTRPLVCEWLIFFIRYCQSHIKLDA